MNIQIDDPEFDAAMQQLVAATGAPQDITLRAAVLEKLERVRRGQDLLKRLRPITSRVAAMPILDDRTPDEIIGYNEHGHFD